MSSLRQIVESLIHQSLQVLQTFIFTDWPLQEFGFCLSGIIDPRNWRKEKTKRVQDKRALLPSDGDGHIGYLRGPYQYQYPPPTKKKKKSQMKPAEEGKQESNTFLAMPFDPLNAYGQLAVSPCHKML